MMEKLLYVEPVTLNAKIVNLLLTIVSVVPRIDHSHQLVIVLPIHLLLQMNLNVILVIFLVMVVKHIPLLVKNVQEIESINQIVAVLTISLTLVKLIVDLVPLDVLNVTKKKTIA